MPEKPEVITVSKALEKKIIGKTIDHVNVYWDNTVVGDTNSFIQKVKNQTIESITTKGKWIVIFLTNNALLVHLRMEGRFYFRDETVKNSKHEHVVFTFKDKTDMRFHDVRKFGKMILLDKKEVFHLPPLNQLGYEFDDENLTSDYLLKMFQKKKQPIKTILLDQHIIAGIGNIYDDEILFYSHLNPLTKAEEITKKEAEEIIKNTKIILTKAIAKGGTTIKSFESSEGVHGLFQNELAIHGQKICPVCKSKVVKIKVNGRGTYYCPNCQN